MVLAMLFQIPSCLLQAFFVERVFKIFDKDGNNKISLAEFLDTMYQYAAHQTNSEKVLFLFKVYDIDGEFINYFFSLGQSWWLKS